METINIHGNRSVSGFFGLRIGTLNWRNNILLRSYVDWSPPDFTPFDLIVGPISTLLFLVFFKQSEKNHILILN